MSNGEQDYGAWRAEQHRRAQAQAFRAAERAQTQYEQAIKHEDYVHAHAGSEGSYIRDSVADERRLAQFHGVRSTEALRLAEMWARVAQALADGELPPLAPGGWLNADRLDQWDDADSQRPRPHPADLTAEQREAIQRIVDCKRAARVDPEQPG